MGLNKLNKPNFKKILAKLSGAIGLQTVFISTVFANHANSIPTMGSASSSAHPQQGGGMQSVIFLVLIIFFFYFLLIRPQMRQSKEQKKMLSALKVGDEIISDSGIVGKINKLDDSFIHLEIASKVIIKIQKQAISKIMPKGSLK